MTFTKKILKDSTDYLEINVSNLILIFSNYEFFIKDITIKDYHTLRIFFDSRTLGGKINIADLDLLSQDIRDSYTPINTSLSREIFGIEITYALPIILDDYNWLKK